MNIKSYMETVMTEGDALEYARVVGQIEAIRNIAKRQPWKAKSLRVAMHAAVRNLKTLEDRYV